MAPTAKPKVRTLKEHEESFIANNGIKEDPPLDLSRDISYLLLDIARHRETLTIGEAKVLAKQIKEAADNPEFRLGHAYLFIGKALGYESWNVARESMVVVPNKQPTKKTNPLSYVVNQRDPETRHLTQFEDLHDAHDSVIAWRTYLLEHCDVLEAAFTLARTHERPMELQGVLGVAAWKRHVKDYLSTGAGRYLVAHTQLPTPVLKGVLGWVYREHLDPKALLDTTRYLPRAYHYHDQDGSS